MYDNCLVNVWQMYGKCMANQGWEFAHWFSEGIARFLPKNEQMSDLLKKTSDSLLRSFLVSDLFDSLTIAHFL